MKFKLFLILRLFCAFEILLMRDVNLLPGKIIPKIVNSKVDIQIDLREKVSSFDEKVLYNLEFDNNEMKSVNYVKTLPNLNSQYFDVKVASNDVKILKYEVVDQGKNKNLNLTFVNEVDKDLRRSKDGNVNIKYSYKTRDPDLVEESKTKFLLRDVNFIDENNSNYPTKFNIEIKNIPKNLKMNTIQYGEDKLDTSKENSYKNQNLKKRIAQEDNEKSEKFEFSLNMSGNKSNNEKKLRVEFVSMDPSIRSLISTLADSKVDQYHPNSSVKLNSDSSGVVNKKTFHYKQANNDDILEPIIVMLMLLCLCMLCFQCFNSSSDRTASSLSKYKFDNNKGNHYSNGETLNYYQR